MTTKNTSSKAPKNSSKAFANPFRKGNYGAIVTTLLAMGVNKQHEFKAFSSQLKKTWEGYSDWSTKDKVNSKTGLNADEKLVQNCLVIQRPDYGAPLHDQGACLDMGWEGEKLWIRLNTKSNSPLKAKAAMRAVRNGKAPVAKAAPKSAPKATTKATKAVKASGKAPILSGREALAFLKSKAPKKAAKK